MHTRRTDVERVDEEVEEQWTSVFWESDDMHAERVLREECNSRLYITKFSVCTRKSIGCSLQHVYKFIELGKV